MPKREKLDLIILLLYPIIASLISLYLKTDFFISILLFFGVPSLFLSIKAKEHVKKTLLFSLMMGIPLSIIIDYIAHFNGTWWVPSPFFNFRILDLVPLEDLLWGVLYLYFIIMFYECFIDKHVTKKLYTKHTRTIVLILLVIVGLFFFILIQNPVYLRIPYFYLISGIVIGIIPILAVLFKFPILFTKLLKTTSYFFFFTFMYEITALKLGWWEFRGEEFIGWVEISGVKFPFEELFFWMILGAMGVLSYYEFFDDDRK
ncbi:MAG: hypothetical protein AABX29_10035 [Nanoarchaeota archaeon]